MDDSSLIFLLLQEEAIIIHVFICVNKGTEWVYFSGGQGTPQELGRQDEPIITFLHREAKGREDEWGQSR